MKLAKQYKVLAKRHDITKQVEALERRYQDVKDKKQEFRKDFDELVDVVGGKKARSYKKKRKLK